MASDDISETVEIAREEVINELVDLGIPPESLEEQWDIPLLEKEIESRFGISFPIQGWLESDDSLH